LLTGFSPFGGETDQETFQNISLGEVDFPEELFEDVSVQAKDFVAKLLVLDPRYYRTSDERFFFFLELSNNVVNNIKIRIALWDIIQN